MESFDERIGEAIDEAVISVMRLKELRETIGIENFNDAIDNNEDLQDLWMTFVSSIVQE